MQWFTSVSFGVASFAMAAVLGLQAAPARAAEGSFERTLQVWIALPLRGSADCRSRPGTA